MAEGVGFEPTLPCRVDGLAIRCRVIGSNDLGRHCAVSETAGRGGRPSIFAAVRSRLLLVADGTAAAFVAGAAT